MLKHDLSGLSVNVGGNHFLIRNIGRIRNLLSFDVCATLVHALIGSRFDYCNSLLYNIADAKIERLQKVQNQAARILTRSPRRDHITPVLKQLHWLKVRERIRYKVLILAHKSFNETAPLYLKCPGNKERSFEKYKIQH